MRAVPPLERDLTPSALSTRRWRARRRRGVHLVHVEASPEAVQAMISLGLMTRRSESSDPISKGAQDLLNLLAAGRVKIV